MKKRVLIWVFAVLLVLITGITNAQQYCCANRNTTIDAGRDLDFCRIGPLTQEECCPEMDYPQLPAVDGVYPASKEDCIQNFFSSNGCAVLSKCDLGCCFDDTEGIAGRCYGLTKGECLPKSPSNKWGTGFDELNRLSGNPCYNQQNNGTEYYKFLYECPRLDVCYDYDDNKDGCVGAGGCYYCPLYDTCISDCKYCGVGRIPINKICQEDTSLWENCSEARCSYASQDCICFETPVNSTHRYCCAILSSIFETYDRCDQACYPDCLPDRHLSETGAQYPDYEKCYCGLELRGVDYKEYCCNDTDGLRFSTSPCFGNGTVRGYVHNQNTGAAISGAKVSIGTFSKNTDINGFYSLGVYAKTNYAWAIADGYIPSDTAQIDVPENAVVYMNFSLKPLFSACQDPAQTPPDIELKPECVLGQKGVFLIWKNPCPADTTGFTVRRKKSGTGSFQQVSPFIPAGGVLSYWDNTTDWNTQYIYSVVAVSPLRNYPYNITVITGWRECEGISTPSGCFNKTHYIACRGQYQFSSIINTYSNCNVPKDFYSCSGSSGSGSVCLGPNHLGQAVCMKGQNCRGIGTPLGMFSVKDLCHGIGCNLETRKDCNACYYDYTSSVVDSCYGCSEAQSCANYKSEDACDRDQCYLSQKQECTYLVLNTQFGKGLCYEPEMGITGMCDGCNDPLVACDAPLCSKFGYCWFNGTRCLACSDTMHCSEFKTEQECTGGVGYNVDPDCPTSMTYSNNTCGLLFCRWIGNKCIKDANYDGTDDSNNDNTPPRTTIVNPPKDVIGAGGYQINFTTSEPVEKTLYCIDDKNTCCPDMETYKIVDKSSVRLPGTVHGKGTFYLRYFSKDLSGNVELVRSLPFALDNAEPEITIAFAVVNNTDPFLSDIIFTITSSEFVTCKESFSPAWYNDRVPIGDELNTRFVSRYIGLPDFSYIYNVTCTNPGGLSTGKDVLVKTDRLVKIYDEWPVNLTTTSLTVRLHVKTPDIGSCTYARLYSDGTVGNPEPFLTMIQDSLKGGFIYETDVTVPDSGTYHYIVKCKDASGSWEDQAYLGFTVDRLAPATKVYVVQLKEELGTSKWYLAPTLLFKCVDPVQGPPREFGCKFVTYCDTGKLDSCIPDEKNKLTFSRYGEAIYQISSKKGTGIYPFCYYSEDAGTPSPNKEQTRCIYPFMIDQTKPRSMITVVASTVYEGDSTVPSTGKLQVNLKGEDEHSGIARYYYTLRDSRNRTIYNWAQREVSKVEQGSAVTVIIEQSNDEWVEDENGKMDLAENETYYFYAYASDYVGLLSDVKKSNGIKITIPPQCENKRKDSNEIGIDCGGPCPPCELKCGNLAIEPGEECDDGELGVFRDCRDIDNFTTGGITCTGNCKINTSGCGPDPGGYCGDGIIKAGETCDKTNLGPRTTCKQLNFESGTLTCGSDCHYNTTLCIGTPQDPCKNGKKDLNEIGIDCGGTCPSCCGNSVIDRYEECDKTNMGGITNCNQIDKFTPGPVWCTADCKLDTSACRDNVSSYCGDNKVDQGEQCDGSQSPIPDCTYFDAFTGGVLRCTPECKYDTLLCKDTTRYCGDGKIDPGEQCDSTWGDITGCTDFDMFISGSLSCRNCIFDTTSCRKAGPDVGYCGDGVTNAGEQCDGPDWGDIIDCTDFGFGNGTLNCINCRFDTIRCKPQTGGYCGDGLIEVGEQCDGTNLGPIKDCTDFDFVSGKVDCTSDCKIDTTDCKPKTGGYCGNNIIDAGETCDKTNLGPITICKQLGFESGTLTCGSDCHFNTTSCTGKTTSCKINSDCPRGKECHPTAQICVAPSCNDWWKNGNETDIDCGGKECKRCGPGQKCISDSDCMTLGGCDPNNHTCVGEIDPCFNGVKDGNESDVDCGGDCMKRCEDQKKCNVNSDCLSRYCSLGKCVTHSCTDKIKNGDEEDIDCGGKCPKKCPKPGTNETKPVCGNGICEEDEKETCPEDCKAKHSPLKILLFLIILLGILGGIGYFGYKKYMAGQQPPSEEGFPGMPPEGQGPEAEQPRFQLSGREIVLLKKKRKEEREKERAKAFETFEEKKKPEETAEVKEEVKEEKPREDIEKLSEKFKGAKEIVQKMKEAEMAEEKVVEEEGGKAPAEEKEEVVEKQPEERVIKEKEPVKRKAAKIKKKKTAGKTAKKGPVKKRKKVKG